MILSAHIAMRLGGHPQTMSEHFNNKFMARTSISVDAIPLRKGNEAVRTNQTSLFLAIALTQRR